jgi:hypothetical protein
VPVSKVALISRRAKKIRKKGEEWTDAIKRASKQLSGGTVGSSSKRSAGTRRRKSVPRKKKASYKPRKRIHQNGTSSKKRDRLVSAKPPGKRRSKAKKVYYEYRRNRSDMPGKLTGTKGTAPSAMNEMLIAKIRDNSNKQGVCEREILYFQEQLRNTKDKKRKLVLRRAIADKKKLISVLKKDTTMLKRLLK